MDKTIEALTRAYQEVVEKKKLDPVDNKELEKDFDDRDDQDIDNDGDIDKSDKYLHKRRKTVKKAIKKSKEDEPDGENGETAVMNPKGEQKEGVKESMTIRNKLLSVLEKRDDHYKGASPAEPMDNNLKGEGAKKMKSDLEKGSEVNDTEAKGHDDASKAGRVTKKSKANPTDKNVKGDMNVINKPVDITQKGGVKESTEELNEELLSTLATVWLASKLLPLGVAAALMAVGGVGYAIIAAIEGGYKLKQKIAYAKANRDAEKERRARERLEKAQEMAKGPKGGMLKSIANKLMGVFKRKAASGDKGDKSGTPQPTGEGLTVEWVESVIRSVDDNLHEWVDKDSYTFGGKNELKGIVDAYQSMYELDENVSPENMKIVMKYGKEDEKRQLRGFNNRPFLNPSDKNRMNAIIAVNRGRAKKAGELEEAVSKSAADAAQKIKDKQLDDHNDAFDHHSAHIDFHMRKQDQHRNARGYTTDEHHNDDPSEATLHQRHHTGFRRNREADNLHRKALSALETHGVNSTHYQNAAAEANRATQHATKATAHALNHSGHRNGFDLHSFHNAPHKSTDEQTYDHHERSGRFPQEPQRDGFTGTKKTS